jgi:hypothetical protein
MTDDLGTMTGFEPVVPDFNKPDDDLVVPAGMKSDADVEKEIQRQAGTPEPTTPRIMTPANPKGEAPREGMGFKENVVGQFKSGTIAGALVEQGDIAAAKGTLRRSVMGDSTFRSAIRNDGTPDPGDAETVRRNATESAEDAIAKQIAYDLSPANLSAASVAGALVGGALSPESFGGLAPQIAKAVPSLAGRAILLPAVDAALTNTLADPIIQGIRVGSGGQTNYELEQTLLAPIIGFGIGAGIAGAGQAVKAIRGRMISPDAPTVEAPSVATPEAPAPIEAQIASVMDEAFPETKVAQAAPVPETGPQPAVIPPAAEAAQTIMREATADAGRIKPQGALADLEPTPGKPAGVFMFDAGRLLIDPERFQFKADGDAEGVLPKLKGVKEWDQSKANQIIAWQQADGSIYVVDGHQRTGLARRLSKENGEPIEIPGLLYREADGFAAQDVMVIAAVKNIGEGSGTILDAAKVMRVQPEVIPGLTNISDYRIRQAADIAKLGDEPYRMTLNEVVTPEQASVVGRMIPEADRQVAAIDAIAKIGPSNLDETVALVTKIRNAELSRAADASQGSLFGDDPATSTIREEIRIVAQAVKQLRSDRALFSRVANDADRIEAAASTMRVDRDAATTIKDDAGRIAQYVQSQADKVGPIRDALLSLAKEVKDGKRSNAEAGRSLVEAVRGTLGRNDLDGPRPVGRADAEPVGAGQRDAGADARAAEPGADGQPQLLIEGVRPVTDGERLTPEANRPLQGGDAAPPKGGLFDEDAINQSDMFAMSARRGSQGAMYPDRRFAVRNQLAGEASKPKAMPADLKPEEIKDFRVTQAIRDLAAELGLKVEIDKRFSIRNALGTYNRKSGVIRLRHDGDLEVFAHEFGHAIDFMLKADKSVADDWKAMIRTHAGELKPLDANQPDPAKKTAIEGMAEFLRMYVTNPAYARQQAPSFAAAFDAWLPTARPDLHAALQRASRISQIESGLSPTQAMESMIVPNTENVSGLAFATGYAKRNGIAPTVRMVVDQFTAKVFGGDNYVSAMVRGLLDARYEATGKPMPRLMRNDPERLFRVMPAAGQTAAQMLANGVRQFGDEIGAPVTRGLAEIMRDALQGEPFGAQGPTSKAFSAYLVARRSLALYDRWRAGEMMNPPVRLSEAEARAAVAEYDAQFPQFRDAGDRIVAFSRAMLERQRDAGLLPNDVFDAITAKSDDYVPFFRDRGDMEAGGGTSSRLERQQVKRIKGSTRDIIDPVESIIYETISAERRIAQNRFVVALDQLASVAGPMGGRLIERVPNTELKGTAIDLAEAVRAAARQQGIDKASAETIIRTLDDVFGGEMNTALFRPVDTTARGERVIFGWKAGERIALKLGDDYVGKGLYDVFEKMSRLEQDVFLDTFARLNGYFSQMVTNAPSFALKNIVMDNITRIFLARDTGVQGRVPFLGIVRGAMTMVFDKEFQNAYNLMGGIRGGVASSFERDLQASNPGNAVHSLMPSNLDDKNAAIAFLIANPSKIPAAIAKAPGGLIKAYVRALEATETMGRLGQAKIVFEHLKKQGLNDADAMFGAAFEARDLLDYDRRGTMVKGINRFFPFFNANLQGLARANRTLLSDVAEGVTQAQSRGGLDKMDADARAKLVDGMTNLAIVATVGTIGAAGYYMTVKDDPQYQKMTPYMRRRYFIIPMGEGAVMTIPKPFDLPGSVMSAVEFALDFAHNRNPAALSQIGNSIEDAFIPRHIGGTGELLANVVTLDAKGTAESAAKTVQSVVGSNPILKTGFEAVSGQTLGFEGNQPRPVVSDSLKPLPNELQVTPRTSEVAKLIGQTFGVSPIVADHVMMGLGATMARDINGVINGFFGSNPNTSGGDALTKAVFGAFYRRDVETGNAFSSDLMKLMARQHGEYVRQANGYKKQLEDGSNATAETIYNRANDNSKSLMTLRGHARFDPQQRQLHPLERSSKVHEILSGALRELSDKEFEVKDRSRKRGEERDTFDVSKSDARVLSRVINSLVTEEVRNGLVIAKHPGYQNWGVIDTSERYKAIEAISPDVAKELRKRLDKAHVLPVEAVADQWPEVQRALLRDRDRANLSRFVTDARRGGARRPASAQAVQ